MLLFTIHSTKYKYEITINDLYSLFLFIFRSKSSYLKKFINARNIIKKLKYLKIK